MLYVVGFSSDRQYYKIHTHILKLGIDFERKKVYPGSIDGTYCRI